MEEGCRGGTPYSPPHSPLTTAALLRIGDTKLANDTLRINRPPAPNQKVRLVSQFLIEPRINPTPARLVQLEIVEQRTLRLRIVRRDRAAVRPVTPRRIRRTPKLRLICLPIHQRDFSALTMRKRREPQRELNGLSRLKTRCWRVPRGERRPLGTVSAGLLTAAKSSPRPCNRYIQRNW